MWKFENPKTIVHTTNNVVIKLLAGSWSEPLDLQPIFPKDLSAYESAKLLRAGLAFARKQGTRKESVRKEVVRTKKPKPNRPVLTLG